jgi:hypothetical protein
VLKKEINKVNSSKAKAEREKGKDGSHCKEILFKSKHHWSH